MSDRDELISKYIDDLKKHVGADTDTDLARLLSLDKRTISSWRTRKSIPQRFLNLLSGKGETSEINPFPKMSALDRSAFSLALFRYTRAVSDLVQTGDYRELWDEFRSSSAFWALMLDARKDLTETLRQRADDPATALALVLHDDVAEPENSTKRVRDVLQKFWSLRDRKDTT